MGLFKKSEKSERDPDTAHDTLAIPSQDGGKGWNSDSDNPPPYEDDAPPYDSAIAGGSAASGSDSTSQSFSPTAQLQIEAIGYDYNTALNGNRLEQIRVHYPDTGDLKYSSVRIKDRSNSCALIRGADMSNIPLIATIYRFGPGRRPKIKILPKDSTATVEDAINSEDVPCELVDVNSRNIFSRTQILETSFGTFEWRYGSRDERKAANGANSLIIMEKVESGLLKSSKKRTRVAQLIRDDEFRTPGTTKHMGGNGGRLMMDLSSWTDGKGTSVEDIEAFAVAGCILMLKREADRFKDNAIAAVT